MLSRRNLHPWNRYERSKGAGWLNVIHPRISSHLMNFQLLLLTQLFLSSLPFSRLTPPSFSFPESSHQTHTHTNHLPILRIILLISSLSAFPAECVLNNSHGPLSLHLSGTSFPLFFIDRVQKEEGKLEAAVEVWLWQIPFFLPSVITWLPLASSFFSHRKMGCRLFSFWQPFFWRRQRLKGKEKT